MALGILCAVLLVWSTINTERAARLQSARYTEVMSALRDINRAALNAEYEPDQDEWEKLFLEAM